jgi:hypothetical protein
MNSLLQSMRFRYRSKTGHLEAESLDESPKTASNHHKMSGETPFLPLNPGIPRRPVKRGRVGSKRNSLAVTVKGNLVRCHVSK